MQALAPPNIPCFLFQGLLSQLSIAHLRKDVPAWATDCQGDNGPAEEATSQFTTRKRHSGQVEGRALSQVFSFSIQVFPSQFQGETENPAEHGAPLLVHRYSQALGRPVVLLSFPKLGFPTAWSSLLAHYSLLPRIQWILVTIIQCLLLPGLPYKQLLGADAKSK